MTRDGGVVDVVDGSHSFYVFNLIGKQWLDAVILASTILRNQYNTTNFNQSTAAAKYQLGTKLGPAQPSLF